MEIRDIEKLGPLQVKCLVAIRDGIENGRIRSLQSAPALYRRFIFDMIIDDRKDQRTEFDLRFWSARILRWYDVIGYAKRKRRRQPISGSAYRIDAIGDRQRDQEAETERLPVSQMQQDDVGGSRSTDCPLSKVGIVESPIDHPYGKIGSLRSCGLSRPMVRTQKEDDTVFESIGRIRKAKLYGDFGKPDRTNFCWNSSKAYMFDRRSSDNQISTSAVTGR